MWLVSLTTLRQTAMQFIGPVLIVLVIHSFFAISKYGLQENVSGLIFNEMLKTLTQLLILFLLLVALVPEEAVGTSIDEFIGGIGIALFCLVVIGIVGGIAGAIIYFIYKGVKKISSKSKDDSNNLNELVSLGLPFCLLFAASLEGVSGAYKFATAKQSSASVHIAAGADKVWRTLETATSPDFPLPGMLWMIPRPVEVQVDEGTTLGANRVVKFAGREGEGLLRLRVVARDDLQATFKVLSDDSPVANWVAHKQLTYRVTPTATGSVLTVSLGYERLLSPAWFFNTISHAAAYLATSTLAKDVKQRSEANTL